MSIQKQGDAAASERILRHNLTINAMHQPTYHALAQNLSAQGRGAEAQDLIAGWAETQPYVPEANLELAWISREQGNVPGAEQALQNALRADPTHPTALAHLGQLYQETGRPDLASAYYQRSLAAKWDQPEVQSRLTTLVEPNSGRRSAMMQNSSGGPILAGNQTIINSQMMASGVPFGTDPQAIALEDVSSNPRPRRINRRGRVQENGSVIAAYPLPDFNGPATAWVPSGSIPGQPGMAFQPPEMGTETTLLPQMVDGSYDQSPSMANNPTLLPPADPAHFGESSPEMTASMPLVDPH
jgi:hypothetical protein